jgi:hypothetical protein
MDGIFILGKARVKEKSYPGTRRCPNFGSRRAG